MSMNERESVPHDFKRPPAPSVTSGWGQSEGFRMINSGWGQTPSTSEPFARKNISSENPASHSFVYSIGENYSGPIETWTNYRAITPDDWALFKEHLIVYSDGKNVEGVEAGWLVCTLCTSKKAQSKDLMHSHIESLKHRRNYDWMLSARVNDPVVAYDPYALAPLSPDDEEVLRRNRLAVIDGWIQCTLCTKRMMDMSFVPAHISTTKHINNLEWASSQHDDDQTCEKLPAGISRRNSDYYCTPCGVTMTSKAIVNAHAGSARHTGHQAESRLADNTHAPRNGIPIADLIELSPKRVPRITRPQPSPPKTRPTPPTNPKPPMADLIDI